MPIAKADRDSPNKRDLELTFPTKAEIKKIVFSPLFFNFWCICQFFNLFRLVVFDRSSLVNKSFRLNELFKILSLVSTLAQ
jgi:hypothetical protein